MAGSVRRAAVAGTWVCALLAFASIAAAAGNGVLFITSNPSGVTVSVDGKSVGETPITVSGVVPGDHVVAVVSDKFETQSLKVTVKGEQLTSVPLLLRAAVGKFVLKTDLEGFGIALDGSDAGVVTKGKDYTASGLAVGPHVVSLVGPFFRTEHAFSIEKTSADKPVEVIIKADTCTGTLAVSSDIPCKGVQVNGVDLPGAAPMQVRYLAPGSYLVAVQTDPIPYLDRVEVTAGRTTEISLESRRDLGKVIITSSVTGASEIRIDGVSVGKAVPLTVAGVVKGPHTVEVLGRPKGNELNPNEEFLLLGRESVWVPAGGTVTVDLSGKALKGNTPDCPKGMVKIPRGMTEGEFWFKEWDADTHPASKMGPGASVYDVPMQGKNLQLEAAGVPVTLTAVESRPDIMTPRRDQTTPALAQHTSYFGAIVPMDYCIDIYEYPNMAGVVPERDSFFTAAQKCDSKGKRLCTSVEWVRACQGPEKRLYPYSDNYQPSRCNTVDNPRSRGIAPSGSYSGCVNGYGLYDMSGNVDEWTIADLRYAIHERSPEDARILSTPSLAYAPALKYDTESEEPDSPKLDFRGGSWLSGEWESSCRAMPNLLGGYVGSDDRPSFIEQLMQLWPSLDPKTELKAAQGALARFQRQWNGADWDKSVETTYEKGRIRGGAAFVAAFENCCYGILRALGKDTHGGGSGGGAMGPGGGGGPMGSGGGMGARGGSGGPMGAGAMGSGGGMGPGGPGGAGMGGGGGGGSQASSAETVSRGSGADARYLGSARLKGWRCCMFAHGRGNRTESRQAGTMGLGGPQGSGGAGALLGGPGGPAAGGR